MTTPGSGGPLTSSPPLEQLRLTHDARDRWTLTLSGEWHDRQGDRLTAALETVLGSSARRLDLTVDLCRATLVDPAILATLMGLRADVARRCGRLTIRCSRGTVHRTVVDAGLAAHLNLYVVTP